MPDYKKMALARAFVVVMIAGMAPFTQAQQGREESAPAGGLRKWLFDSVKHKPLLDPSQPDTDRARHRRFRLEQEQKPSLGSASFRDDPFSDSDVDIDLHINPDVRIIDDHNAHQARFIGVHEDDELHEHPDEVHLKFEQLEDSNRHYLREGLILIGNTKLFVTQP